MNVMSLSSIVVGSIQKQIEVFKNNGFITWGEVKVYSINVEGINQAGNYFKEPLNLGVTADGKRLFYIEIWAIPDKDPNFTQLNTDINSILAGLKLESIQSLRILIKSAFDPASLQKRSIRCLMV